MLMLAVMGCTADAELQQPTESPRANTDAASTAEAELIIEDVLTAFPDFGRYPTESLRADTAEHMVMPASRRVSEALGVDRWLVGPVPADDGSFVVQISGEADGDPVVAVRYTTAPGANVSTPPSLTYEVGGLDVAYSSIAPDASPNRGASAISMLVLAEIRGAENQGGAGDKGYSPEKKTAILTCITFIVKFAGDAAACYVDCEEALAQSLLNVWNDAACFRATRTVLEDVSFTTTACAAIGWFGDDDD